MKKGSKVASLSESEFRNIGKGLQPGAVLYRVAFNGAANSHLNATIGDSMSIDDPFFLSDAAGFGTHKLSLNHPAYPKTSV